VEAELAGQQRRLTVAGIRVGGTDEDQRVERLEIRRSPGLHSTHGGSGQIHCIESRRHRGLARDVRQVATLDSELSEEPPRGA
jgi:hypothetical protein